MDFIKTFEDLFNLQDMNDHTGLDLMFIRTSIRLIDGFVILMGNDAINHIKAYQIKLVDFDKWTQNEKDYFTRHYGG